MPKLNILEDLYELELRDIYDAEKQLARALPKMVKKTTDNELKTMLENMVQDSQEQSKRLEQVFTALDLKPKTRHCAGMEGILTEANEVLSLYGEPAAID